MEKFLLIVFIILNIFVIIKDKKQKIIDNMVIFIMLFLSIFNMFIFTEMLYSKLLGSLFLSVPLYLLYLYNSELIGGGDIKLLFVSGLFLGLKWMFFSWEIAMLFGLFFLVYLFIFKKYKKNTIVALGSFIGTGNVIVSLFLLLMGW